jgi:L-fuconolactonase
MWVSQGAEGVRLSPTTRSPGSDSLVIWRQAAELGIPVSCLGSADGFTLPSFEHVVKEFPSLPIIIEHHGTPHVPQRGRQRLDLRQDRTLPVQVCAVA